MFFLNCFILYIFILLLFLLPILFCQVIFFFTFLSLHFTRVVLPFFLYLLSFTFFSYIFSPLPTFPTHRSLLSSTCLAHFFPSSFLHLFSLRLCYLYTSSIVPYLTSQLLFSTSFFSTHFSRSHAQLHLATSSSFPRAGFSSSSPHASTLPSGYLPQRGIKRALYSGTSP